MIDFKNPRHAFAALAGAVLALGLFRLRGLGFYNDDYVLLAGMAAAPGHGLVDAVRSLAGSSGGLFWTRPLNLLFYPALFSAFGASPLPYAVFSIVMQLALCWTFYRTLMDEEVPGPAALLAALLAALHPAHDATRLWASGFIAPCALLGTLSAMRFYRRWLAGAAWPWLAAALVVFAAATLLYEASAPLVLLLLWTCYRRARSKGLAPLPACLSGLRACSALWGLFLVLMATQRVLVPRLQGLERHPVSLSLGHAFQVLSSGLECGLGNRLLHLMSRQAVFAAGEFQPRDWLFWAAAAAALAWLLRRLAAAGEGRAEPWPILGAAWFVLGYVPYFFDRAYTPSIFDASNRVNLVSSLGAAWVLAWAWDRARASAWPALRRCATPALTLLAAGFLLSGWSSNAQWARAYGLQKKVLAALSEGPQAGQAGPVLVFGVPGGVGSAPVFCSSYDLPHALLLRRGPGGPQPYLAEGRVSFEPDAAVVGGSRLPYRGLRAYDHAAGTWTALRGSRDGEAFLAARPRLSGRGP